MVTHFSHIRLSSVTVLFLLLVIGCDQAAENTDTKQEPQQPKRLFNYASITYNYKYETVNGTVKKTSSGYSSYKPVEISVSGDTVRLEDPNYQDVTISAMVVFDENDKRVVDLQMGYHFSASSLERVGSHDYVIVQNIFNDDCHIYDVPYTSYTDTSITIILSSKEFVSRGFSLAQSSINYNDGKLSYENSRGLKDETLQDTGKIIINLVHKKE